MDFGGDGWEFSKEGYAVCECGFPVFTRKSGGLVVFFLRLRGSVEILDVELGERILEDAYLFGIPRA